ncbi:Immunoglobulin I-set and Fibronectin domain containing protein [Aphelenchoides fujianensis]|nr:Immunoglobulin I-set and Fibronectin domain containing protein [Aphelenchoides fujianensis]
MFGAGGRWGHSSTSPSKDGRPISTAGRRKFASSQDDRTATLRISEPTSADVGAYRCTILHEGRETSSEARVAVRPRPARKEEEAVDQLEQRRRQEEVEEETPRRARKRPVEEADEIEPLRFLHELRDDSIHVGDSATLSVAYSSPSAPDLEWYRNGVRVIALPARFRIESDAGRATLTIENASLDCAGEWELVARTPAGEFRSKCALKVEERRSALPPARRPIEDDVDEREGRQKRRKQDEEMNVQSTTKRKIADESERDVHSPMSRRERKESETGALAKRPRTRREDEEVEEGSDPPAFHHVLSDLEARAGERVVLSVTSTTSPQPAVQWLRNGVPIERTDADYVVRSDCGRYELEILFCRKQDDAEWTAVGTNRFGRCESACRLRILDRVREEAPHFGFELQDLQCRAGAMLVLEASVRGRPDPTISWWLNGRQLVHGSEFRMIGDGRLQSLSVLDATAAHSGRYEIRAENALGAAVSSCTVTVNDPTHDPFAVNETRAPVVRLPLWPIRELPEGSEIQLVCTISGSPTPRIEWRKDDMPIFFANFRYDNGVATLIIDRAERWHSGVYSCTAANQFGSCRSTGVLYVQPSVESKTGPPRIEEPLTNVTLVAGRELTLECRASGTPMPTITWYKDGIKMLPDRRLLLYTDRRGVARLNLMECRPEDSGEYGVEASSPFGSDFTHALVKVVAPIEEEERRKAAASAPVIVRHLRDSNVHRGNRELLECEVRSSTTTTADFLHDGRQLAESRTLRTYFDGRLALIKIFDADPTHHNGEYEVVFSNRNGQTSSKATVVVEEAETEGFYSKMPVFSVPLRSVRLAAVGEAAEFRCVVEGSPAPQVHFLRNGKALTAEETEGVRIEAEGDEHVLRIAACTAEWVGAQITAAASNAFGLVHSNAEILLETNPE